MSDGVNFSQSLKFFQSGAVENKPIPQSHPLTSQDVIPNIVKNTVAAFDNSMGLHAEHAEVRGRAQSITAEHSPATQHADQVAEATIKPTTQNKLQEKLEKRRGSVVSRNNEMKAERKETLLGRSSKSMQNQINDARRGIKLGASRLTPGSSIHTFVSNDLPVNTGARRDSIETQNPSRHEIMEMRLEEQEPQTTFVDFPNKGEESPLDGSSVYATTSLPHENTQEKTIPFTKYITNIKKGKLNSSQQKKLINLTTNSLRNDMLNSLKQINPQFMHTKNETSSIHISNAIQAQNTVINVVTNSLFDVSNQKEFERQYNFFC